MKERFVHTLWCDDIRQEVGNKPSFMGVYTGGLVVQSLPVKLPRLCVWTWVVSPIDQPVGKLTLSVMRDDGQVLASLEHDSSAMEFPAVPEATRQQLMFGLALGPISIDENLRYLKVVASIEGEEWQGPKLHVTAAPAPIEAAG
jgi:hypothetical protein